MTKSEHYQSLLPQIESVITGEPDLIANMANVAALLHDTFRFWWTGFYIVRPSLSVDPHRQLPVTITNANANASAPSSTELVLGPFQGPLACTRIPFGKGVCGSAWQQRQTIIVPDVHRFPGHIACSSLSRSEIVVPLFASVAQPEPPVIAVLDIDSAELATFDEIDRSFLEKIASLLANHA